VISGVICVYVSKEGDIEEHGTAFEQLRLYLCLYILGMQLLYFEHHTPSTKLGRDRLCPKLSNHDEARSDVQITSGVYLHSLPCRDA
jgi:hypothetical protein